MISDCLPLLLGSGGSAYGGLSGIVEAEEEEFGVLVGQAQVGQQVPDCISIVSAAHIFISESTYTNQ